MDTQSATRRPVGRGHNQPRRVSVLGATGSIGESTLDLIGRANGDFEVVALTAHSNVAKLAELAVAHNATRAVIADEALYQDLKDALSGSGIQAAAGENALIEAGAEAADCVVAAIVGVAGLRPSLAAARQGSRVALANKECLVAAGELFMREVNAAGTALLPVDSEHCAVQQALGVDQSKHVECITITASGGPFRTWSPERIAAATPDQALCHPNWTMGAKITIDSATLMNKGLELIEAFHLFPVTAEQLDVVVHPQSIVHCLVSFCDGSVMAQLANPDMRTPIAYSLAWPSRMAAPTPRLDLVKISELTFEAPDQNRFPALKVARSAMNTGGSAPNVLNAANECAVAAFLKGQLTFPGIVRTVAECLEIAESRGILGEASSIDDILEVDRETRELARNVIAG
ncbi:MAG: 1-deoxy-D-xylulose-5-phosphate reductoisomerase [Hyphomicrobiaceae bacterium]